MAHGRMTGAMAICLVATAVSDVGATTNPTAQPPSSLRPAAKTQVVRISHRHRAIVECVRVASSPSCVSHVVDADTATRLSLDPIGVVAASFEPSHGSVPVVFRHQVGPREQQVVLPVGSWLVNWPGASKLERLEVRAGVRTEVALATVSGVCEVKADRCVLIAGPREQRIHVAHAH